MLWFILVHLFTTLFTWVSNGRLSTQEKELEILVLRQQVRLLERQLDKPLPTGCATRFVDHEFGLGTVCMAFRLTRAKGLLRCLLVIQGKR